MARQKAGARKPGNGNGATIGYEASLWQMADKLRNNMDAAEYKHVVLGLLFLKYISDAFAERHASLGRAVDDPNDEAFLPPTTPNRAAAVIGLREDPDEYRAHNIFWVPPEARWPHLTANARQPAIGRIVDDAMAAIERDNPTLKGVLPKDFAREGLNKETLGQLVDLVGNIMVGDADSRAKDTLGRVYEYFLSQFASAEGKQGGQFYTPRCIVKTLVEMLEPFNGRVYDPCCGSAGMFVQSIEFIRAHAGGPARRAGAGPANAAPGSRGTGADISIYGQESNFTTWRLAKMNLAIRGIEAHIECGDTFKNDRNPDLRADFILANPPFNVSDWDGHLLRDDKRWKYGVPPAGNANFAWVQHMVYHLAPTGTAGFVLANGSMSSNQSGEGEIRKNLVESDLVDCMVALPGQLFYSTQIPACLWFLTRDKRGRGLRDRRGEILFIDARKLGQMADRTHRELTDVDIARIADTYHAWRGEPVGGVVTGQVGEPVAARADVPTGLADGGGAGQGGYQDIPGFCKSASLDEVRKHGHVLTPGRYVGAEEVEDDGVPFEEKMSALVTKLRAQQAESARLDAEITHILQELGYGE